MWPLPPDTLSTGMTARVRLSKTLVRGDENVATRRSGFLNVEREGDGEDSISVKLWNQTAVAGQEIQYYQWPKTEKVSILTAKTLISPYLNMWIQTNQFTSTP